MTDAEYDYLFRDADPRWKAYYRMRREEYRKQHPRTNFDKWKEELTAEDVWDAFCGYRDDCVCCPTEGNCKDQTRCHEEVFPLGERPGEGVGMSVPKNPPRNATIKEAQKRRMLACPWSISGGFDTAEELAKSVRELRMWSGGVDDEVASMQLAEFVFHTHHPRKNERLVVDISYGMGWKNEWVISVNRRRK